MLLGITRDSVFGPVMTLALGGVLTELYRDVARRVLPIDASVAADMLSELKSRPLLAGFRGAAAADIPALVNLMVDVSEFFLSCGETITELELNPVIVLDAGHGVVIVDALLALVDDGR
jgi:acyl-CoA synthetase (NDP forming)